MTGQLERRWCAREGNRTRKERRGNETVQLEIKEIRHWRGRSIEGGEETGQLERSLCAGDGDRMREQRRWEEIEHWRGRSAPGIFVLFR